MNADRGWAALEVLNSIVRTGTLSAAARSMGIDQTTASRRLAALEKMFGTPLFARFDGRLIPTAALQPILGRLQAIAEDAAVAMAVLRRTSDDLQTQVRMTSVGFILQRVLAVHLPSLVAQNPNLRLDMIDDDQVLSFDKRDIDIAIRLGRRAENSTRIRSLGGFRFRLCRPAGLEAQDGLPVVHYGEEHAHLPEMAALARVRPEAKVAFTGNRIDLLIEAALAFGAEVMLPEPYAKSDPRFVFVEGPETTAERSCFLMIHPDRSRVPSVQAVARWAEACFQRWREMAAAGP